MLGVGLFTKFSAPKGLQIGTCFIVIATVVSEIWHLATTQEMCVGGGEAPLRTSPGVPKVAGSNLRRNFFFLIRSIIITFINVFFSLSLTGWNLGVTVPGVSVTSTHGKACFSMCSTVKLAWD